MPWWPSEWIIRSHSSRARASTSVSGTSTFASATTASSTASRNSASTRFSSASRSLAADVLAQLVERVEAGGVGGEVVVELGQLLALDLVDRDGELGLAAA